jgi:hypothetical protein
VRRAGPNVSEAVWAAVYRESRLAYHPLAIPLKAFLA